MRTFNATFHGVPITIDAQGNTKSVPSSQSNSYNNSRSNSRNHSADGAGITTTLTADNEVYCVTTFCIIFYVYVSCGDVSLRCCVSAKFVYDLLPRFVRFNVVCCTVDVFLVFMQRMCVPT